MALPESQASLHCAHKAVLYAYEMTLGNRIKAARERLVPKVTQKIVGDVFGITDQAVSQWELDTTIPEVERLPELARTLQVPLDWLLEGPGAPPPRDDLRVRIEAMTQTDRDLISAMIDTLAQQRALQKTGRVA